jgi:hypothetical protein
MIRGYESPYSTASPNRRRPTPSATRPCLYLCVRSHAHAQRERGSGELMPRALAFSQRRAQRCLRCAVLCYAVLCSHPCSPISLARL